MREADKPAWLEGWTPAPAKPKGKGGNPTWTPGMRSPNPNGRPKGIVDKRMRISRRMLDDAECIVSVLIEQALEGDTGAASLVLARVLPALRNQAEKVAFPFDASAPIARQIEQVLDAMASGMVAADVGRLIIDSIKSLADVRAVEELEARIITLEAKQI